MIFVWERISIQVFFWEESLDPFLPSIPFQHQPAQSITKSFRYLKWRNPEFKAVLGGWGNFPYISLVHTAYIGVPDDPSILGTNEMFAVIH